MEQLSKAYVQAVAAAAACKFDVPSIDDDSIDVTLSKRTRGTLIMSPKLDLQLKSTGIDCRREHDIAFPLRIKNYDDLRAENVAVPRILVVILVPVDTGDWTRLSEQELTLKHCAYWCSLRGAPTVPNETSRTIPIPRTQLFDRDTLDGIFGRLANGDLP